eukprot:TRINITY_DN8116_c0_g1_i1.p1 TRINITY_DN8116_c0_g1~~TRINITY_DN8116_c0_g1_i1.p1  ORF type:complete len:901 (-),score=246.29 TRINITY_DN8116_c0_g1_i1:62-2416(-)
MLGSGTGRLPLVAFLRGFARRTVAVEADGAKHARAVLALQRLRELLQSHDNLTDFQIEPEDDKDDNCKDWAAKGECENNRKFMLENCARSCHARKSQPNLLEWRGRTVELLHGAPTAANFTRATIAVVLQDSARSKEGGKELAALAGKLEADLPPGSIAWSLDRLPLVGSTVQEALPAEVVETDAKGKAPRTVSVPNGGLVTLTSFYLRANWSRAIPCFSYLRVPAPPRGLRPASPSLEEASRLRGQAMEELGRLGAMKVSGAVLSEAKFIKSARNSYGVPSDAAARRLLRAFGRPTTKSSDAEPDRCSCRASGESTFELGSLALLDMLLHGVHVQEDQCKSPPCTAGDKLLALAMGELRRAILAGDASSPESPPQVLKDFACFRLSDRRTLLHAALGRKDLELATAAVRTQGVGAFWCRDAQGRTPLHVAASGGAMAASTPPHKKELNTTYSMPPRVNSSVATAWALSKLRSLDLLAATDAAGRTAAFAAGDRATLSLLLNASGEEAASVSDSGGRNLLWHGAALRREGDLLKELLRTTAMKKEVTTSRSAEAAVRDGETTETPSGSAETAVGDEGDAGTSEVASQVSSTASQDLPAEDSAAAEKPSEGAATASDEVSSTASQDLPAEDSAAAEKPSEGAATASDEASSAASTEAAVEDTEAAAAEEEISKARDAETQQPAAQAIGEAAAEERSSEVTSRLLLPEYLSDATRSPLLAAVRRAVVKKGEKEPAGDADAARQAVSILAKGAGLAASDSYHDLLLASGLSAWEAARAAPQEAVAVT